MNNSSVSDGRNLLTLPKVQQPHQEPSGIVPGGCPSCEAPANTAGDKGRGGGESVCMGVCFLCWGGECGRWLGHHGDTAPCFGFKPSVWVVGGLEWAYIVVV